MPMKLVFLGGACEVGKNCLVIENDGEMVVVDAGLSFPDIEHPGVELIVPDFQYLHENRDKIKAIILTHGHEDHIGALPHLLRHVRAPVYGSELTLAIIQSRIDDMRAPADIELREVGPDKMLSLESMEFSFFNVCHSIPGNMGFLLRCRDGLVLHTGDFKLEDEGVSGGVHDMEWLREAGRQGVTALICDTTNVESLTSGSESKLAGRFDEIFREAKGKIIFSTFATNVQRLQLVFDVAARYGRKIFISGRSMMNIIRISREKGYLDFQEKTHDLAEIENFEPDETLVVCTGTQGEPLSALRLIASGQHRQLKLEAGDTVVLSASSIPGNEAVVNSLLNTICRVGARAVYGSEMGVHVSGHGGLEEVLNVVRAVKPKYLVPFHGEHRHIQRLRDGLEKSAIEDVNLVVVENGKRLVLSGGALTCNGRAHVGAMYLGSGAVEDEEATVRERRLLSRSGAVTVSLCIDRQTRELCSGPTGASFGCMGRRDAELLAEICGELRREFEFEGSLPETEGEIERIIRDFVKKRYQRQYRRDPIVLVIINEVERR